mmetsp:Transcript_880/g.2194  ORF Transcript_880/g.2194 Transcript_880/m.2194 type:complete len:339 (-) Transcript_880:208-1224(-)
MVEAHRLPHQHTRPIIVQRRAPLAPASVVSSRVQKLIVRIVVPPQLQHGLPTVEVRCVLEISSLVLDAVEARLFQMVGRAGGELCDSFEGLGPLGALRVRGALGVLHLQRLHQLSTLGAHHALLLLHAIESRSWRDAAAAPNAEARPAVLLEEEVPAPIVHPILALGLGLLVEAVGKRGVDANGLAMDRKTGGSQNHWRVVLVLFDQIRLVDRPHVRADELPARPCGRGERHESVDRSEDMLGRVRIDPLPIVQHGVHRRKRHQNVPVFDPRPSQVVNLAAKQLSEACRPYLAAHHQLDRVRKVASRRDAIALEQTSAHVLHALAPSAPLVDSVNHLV